MVVEIAVGNSHVEKSDAIWKGLWAGVPNTVWEIYVQFSGGC